MPHSKSLGVILPERLKQHVAEDTTACAEDTAVCVYVVTSCDSRYFPLAKGLNASIIAAERALYPERINMISAMLDVPVSYPLHMNTWKIEFCVLDAGMTEQEVAFFEAQGVKVTKPKLTLDFGGRSIPQNMAGFVERHNISKYFPGAEIYVWMDADTWLQDWYEGLDPFIAYATQDMFPIVPEVSRAASFNYEHQETTKGWSIGNYTKFFGAEAAAAFAMRPMFNSGVFAAKATHPIWDFWGAALQFALDQNQGKPDFGIDQIALNYVIYSMPAAIQAYALPMTCNWMVTHAMPYRDEQTSQLRMPIWPFDKIGIVHLLNNTKWVRVGVERIDMRSNPPKVTTGDAIHLDYFWVVGNPMEQA